MLIGLIALLLYVIIGAFIPTVVKLSLREIPPFTLTFLRFFIATAVIFPIYWKQRPKKLTQFQFIKLLAVGSLGGVFNTALYAYAIQFTSVIVSQVLYSIVPIIVASLGFFLIKEKISKPQLAGMVIGFFGVLFLIYHSAFSQDILTLGTPFGNTIILIAIFAWSFYTILSRSLSKTYSSITISFATFASSLPVLGIFVPIEMLAKGFSFSMITGRGFFELLFLGIVSSAIVYSLYQFGIKKTSAFIASLTFYLSPVAVAIPATIFLHEKITVFLFVGAALILFGVFLATTFEQLKKRI